MCNKCLGSPPRSKSFLRIILESPYSFAGGLPWSLIRIYIEITMSLIVRRSIITDQQIELFNNVAHRWWWGYWFAVDWPLGRSSRSKSPCVCPHWRLARSPFGVFLEGCAACSSVYEDYACCRSCRSRCLTCLCVGGLESRGDHLSATRIRIRPAFFVCATTPVSLNRRQCCILRTSHRSPRFLEHSETAWQNHQWCRTSNNI